MMWETSAVPAENGARRSTANLRFAPGDVCTVEIDCDGFSACGSASDLFEALSEARGILESHDISIRCNGARADVFPSPMLRQSTMGRYAYVLTLPRTDQRPPAVDIFAAASDSDPIVSVSDQLEAFKHWTQSPLQAQAPSPAARAIPPELIQAAKLQPGGWVYDISGEFGPDDAVPPAAIRGAWRVDERGEIAGEFIPNPAFDGD